MSLGPITLLSVLPMVVIAVAIVLVVVRLSRNPARRPVASGQPGAVGAPPPDGTGQWYAHLRREGHLDPLAGFGTLSLAQGNLTFTPEDDPGSGWSYPAASFGVWSNPAVANADLTVDSQATGKLGMTVSHQRINRLSQNTIKMLRERDVSGEFIRAMAAAGATVVG